MDSARPEARDPITVLIVIPSLDAGAADAGAVDLTRLLSAAGHHVIVASPCSGHGFKFAPIIGDILADLTTTGTTSRDISRFKLDRLR